MSQNKLNAVTDAEWEVMRIIWAQGKTTSREVQTILSEKKAWKATTVKTLLSRLVDKQLVATEKLGNKYLYYPLVEERQSVENVAEDLLHKVCSRKVGKVVATILSESLLSFADIEQLEALLKDKRKTAVEKVPCNCTPGQCQCHLK
jgi:CopY/TcrY family copper transport repressor